MEVISIICPKCKVNLSLPADKGANDKLILVCPKCQYSGVLNSYLKLPNPQVEKPNPGEIVSDSTVIVGHTINQALTIGQLKETKSMNIFKLQQGVNRFGRKATNSICEHQFSNNDTFISRKHFEVDVIFNKATLVYDHRLQDLGSTNGTKINSQKLSQGDIVLLKAGDRLLAGKTELIFELPLSPDDTTLA